MAKVSIITRTKNRVLLLNRALQSVTSQTFGDWEHVIVNDGGAPAPVEKLCAGRANTRIVHHPQSLGMEAASNAGLRQASGQYVVIHDDDDSWQSEFLSAAVGWLDENSADARAAGVICHSLRVRERVDGESVVQLDVSPNNDWLHNVTLFRVAANNPFPPISFVYRREVLDQIGYYREDLPVVGDWEFNLRFLLHYDIGVIARPLANYHQRVSNTDGVYTNSVFGSQIRVWETRLRNELLRRDLGDGKIGLGVLVNLAKSFEDMSNQVHQHQSAFGYLKDKVWNFGTRVGLIRSNGKI
jgi:glycosyltransferase involved in cell wall biosynthesis